jgi:hypothetical protein
MKLKPRQLIGLAAIVVFGGVLIFTLVRPNERAIMDQHLASLPSLSAPTELPALPPAPLPSLATPAAPTSGVDSSGKAIWELSGIDYYALGSQAAKDDLYCAGVLNAEFDAIKADAHPDKISILIRDGRALDDAGIARLKSEKAIDTAGAGASLAWADKAAKDYAANALRISVADCTKRAAALSGVVEEAGN